MTRQHFAAVIGSANPVTGLAVQRLLRHKIGQQTEEIAVGKFSQEFEPT